MTAQIKSLDGKDLDPRLVGLERVPAYWLGRASVRLEEARMWFPRSQQKSAQEFAVACEYQDRAARLVQ
jgi:hypothetical protein